MRTNLKHEELWLSDFPIRIKKFTNHITSRIHWHEEIEILYFVSGEVNLIINMKEITVKAGDIVVINGNELHTGALRECGNEYFCIHIKTAFFHNLIGNEYVSFENHINSDVARELLEALLRQRDKSGFVSNLSMKRALFEFFVYLSENFTKSVLSESEYKKKFTRLDTFNSVIKYINKHYFENLTVDFLAKEFFISPSYFAHIFKDRAKKSLVDYLNEVRIRRAKSFLENEDAGIGEIALRVGYSDINYFCRRFKRECGITPREYRKSFAVGNKD